MISSLFTSVPVSGAAPRGRHVSARTVTVYEGMVDAKSAARLFQIVERSRDKVIGLKITVDNAEPGNDRYDAGMDENRLIISSGDPMNAPVELVVSGPIGTTWNMHAVDGFYLIKFGGMHAAGAMSWGAEPVDEAKIRLNPSVRIVTEPF
jgi:hypothetical protein